MLLVLAALAGGCGGNAPEDRTDVASDDRPALATFTSENGALQVELRTLPEQPPPRGVVSVELRVKDARTGEPVDGLSLDVVPWMVAMGHGASGKPRAVAKGGGVYLVEKLNLFMAGTWELRTEFTGRFEDRAAPAIRVR